MRNVKSKAMQLSLIALIVPTILAAQSVYVATNGNDFNKGSKEEPLASLEKAKKLIKEKTGKNAHIYLRGGIYYLPQPLEINEGDIPSGSLTIEPFAEEPVTIRSSILIKKSAYTRIQSQEALARIVPGLRDSIVEIDLTLLNIKHAKAFDNLFNGSGNIFELFMNDQRMPLSRYPNTGFMTIKKVLVNGGGQETSGTWSPYFTEGQKPPEGKPRPGVFEYRDERTAKWVKAVDRGVWLKGFWRIPWENEAVRVSTIDTVEKTVTLAEPVPGGIGNKYTRPYGDGKERYWLMNLLEEIDMPGEWAIDFKDQKLYFYPPGEINDYNLRISDRSEPAVTLNNVENVSLKKLSFDETLGDGILIKNGKNNVVAGCTIKNVGGYAVKIDMGFNHTVQSCDLHDLGIGGVWLSGGDSQVSPRIPANHKVINNHIYHYSVLQRVYASAIDVGYVGGGTSNKNRVQCVGMYVAHNLVHDSPHVGILFGGWDNVFEYNEVFDFCQVSDDMGAFYSFETYPNMGNQTFAYNFIHNSSIGDGIYFDYDHRDMHIYGNVIALKSDPKRRGTGVLYKIGTQARNPYSEDCYNNIAINCNLGYEFVTSQPEKSRIENNVSVNCQLDFKYKIVKDKAYNDKSDMASGKNISYNEDPGFFDLKGYNFQLKATSQIFKDLPSFKPIPMEKIGLYMDEYRKKLPTDAELKRFNPEGQQISNGTEILDRN